MGTPAPNSPPKPDRDDPGAIQQLAKASTVGSNFAFAVMGMGGIGWLVQKYWLVNAAPWPMLAGFALGLIGGFYQFVRDAMRAEQGSK